MRFVLSGNRPQAGAEGEAAAGAPGACSTGPRMAMTHPGLRTAQSAHAAPVCVPVQCVHRQYATIVPGVRSLCRCGPGTGGGRRRRHHHRARPSGRRCRGGQAPRRRSGRSRRGRPACACQQAGQAAEWALAGLVPCACRTVGCWLPSGCGFCACIDGSTIWQQLQQLLAPQTQLHIPLAPDSLRLCIVACRLLQSLLQAQVLQAEAGMRPAGPCHKLSPQHVKIGQSRHQASSNAWGPTLAA